MLDNSIIKLLKKMANDTEQLILHRLEKINSDLEKIHSNLKLIKTDINLINVQMAKITTDLNWIKILFPIAFVFILFLLGLLLKVIGDF